MVATNCGMDYFLDRSSYYPHLPIKLLMFIVMNCRCKQDLLQKYGTSKTFAIVTGGRMELDLRFATSWQVKALTSVWCLVTKKRLIPSYLKSKPIIR